MNIIDRLRGRRPESLPQVATVETAEDKAQLKVLRERLGVFQPEGVSQERWDYIRGRYTITGLSGLILSESEARAISSFTQAREQN